MAQNILARQSVRIGIDRPDVVLIVNNEAFLRMPPDKAREIAQALIANADLLEYGQKRPAGLAFR